MLNKNTWGVKKCGANQKQHCKQAGATKRLISAEAKKLRTLVTFIIVYRYEKRWPSDKANRTCENML